MLNFRTRLDHNWRQIRKLGASNALRVKLMNRLVSQLARLGWKPKPVLWVQPPRSLYPMCLRAGTSDFSVLCQIFVEDEYAPMREVLTPRLIIDCGANVGYSAAYFLSTYPGAELIALEPDPRNEDLCAINLAPYRDRARVLRAGIWSHPTRLMVLRGKYRDGYEWATQVREAHDNEEADCEGVDVPSLIRLAGDRDIDILKIDVEGSECQLFAANTVSWLPRVRNLAIELHDDYSPLCSSNFFSALENYSYELVRSGELVICRNMQAR